MHGIQYFVLWYFFSTSLNCLPTDEITESVVDNKSHYDNDDDPMMDVTNFNLITESRLLDEPHKRVKRVHVFRPLFVYRQEQIKRKRIIEKRKERSRKIKPNGNKQTNLPVEHQTTKQQEQPCTCCNKCRRY